MDVVVTGLVGFGGVLVGAALTGVIELWRQLLEGRAAARIVRMEIQDNANRCIQSVTHSRHDIRLKDDAWRDLRARLVPLLPEIVLQDLASGYGAIFIVEDWISKVQLMQNEVKDQLQQWVDNMTLHSGFLLQLERRSRFAQMLDLVFGRPTFPTPSKGKQGVEQLLEEKKQKLSEMFEAKR